MERNLGQRRFENSRRMYSKNITISEMSMGIKNMYLAVCPQQEE
jgi:hypothetical protein